MLIGTENCKTCWNCTEWWTDPDTGLQMAICQISPIFSTFIDQITEDGCDGYSRESED